MAGNNTLPPLRPDLTSFLDDFSNKFEQLAVDPGAQPESDASQEKLPPAHLRRSQILFNFQRKSINSIKEIEENIKEIEKSIKKIEDSISDEEKVRLPKAALMKDGVAVNEDLREQEIEDLQELHSAYEERVRLLKAALMENVADVLNAVNGSSPGMMPSHRTDVLLDLMEISAKTIAMNKEFREPAIEALKELHSTCGKTLDEAANQGELTEFFSHILFSELHKLKDETSIKEKLNEEMETALGSHPLFKASMLGAVARGAHYLGDLEKSRPFLERLIERVAEERRAGELDDQNVKLVLKRIGGRISLSSTGYAKEERTILVDVIRQKLLDPMTDTQAKESASSSLEGSLNQSFDKLLISEISGLKDVDPIKEKFDEWIEAAFKGHPFKGAMLGAVARNTHRLGDLEHTSDFLNELIEAVSQKHRDEEMDDREVVSFTIGVSALFASSSPEHHSSVSALFDTIDETLLNAMKDTQIKENLYKHLTRSINKAKNRDQTQE